MNGRIDITVELPPSASPLPMAFADAVHISRTSAIQQTVRTVVLVFGAVLVIRAVFVEPFSVPTGSMAPTFLGVHRSANCPNCGLRVAVGTPPEGSHESQHFAGAACPNCRTNLALDAVADSAGDRVLVDKLAFEWRGPRRWEPVVFQVPDDSAKPFVKRVVGLPGERVRVRDGDVIVNDEPARKPLALCRSLQIPVLDMAHVPAQGWGSCWRADPLEASDRTPWVDGGELVFPVESAKSLRWLVYGGGEPIRDACAYNAADPEQGSPVHDFLVSCDVVIQRGAGEIALALTDGFDEVIAVLPVGSGGQTRLTVGGLSREARAMRLRPGQRVRIELAFVDRRAILAVDGDEVLPALDLPAVPQRPAVSRPLKIGAWGVAATISKLRLGRDVHYGSFGTNGVVDECPLGADEYYVLGDNSANSDDSRYWSKPGIPAAALLGKPLFVHQPGRGPRGFDWTRFGRVR